MEKSKSVSDSFLAEEDNGPLSPIKPSQNPQKNPVFYGSHVSPRKTSNRNLSVLVPLSSSKIQYTQTFQQLLTEDDSNPNLAIATILGPKQTGKSFLADLIISKEEKSASRLLSKNGSPIVNMPTFELKGNNGERILLFDAHQQLSNQSFLWCYFLSSVIVLNLPQGDKKGEEQFISQLEFVQTKLQSEPEQLSLPHLIIVRRDCETKEFKDKQFLNKVQKYGLFHPDIATMNMAYPGSKDLKSTDIIDVSQNLLNPIFINDSQNLSYMLKSSKPKTIKGNSLNSKIAVLTLDPLTQSINKQGKVNTNKVWTDVIETLSVGYYNYYMKKYQEELSKQFADQKPSDKYTLYKRLSKVRRNVDRKVEGFNTISGDPIFEKYRNKIQQKINAKEKLVKQINTKKSIQQNDKLAKELFSQMNDSNCEVLIQKYCESNLDDHKAEVLLSNFENVIKEKQKDLEKTKGIKPTAQMIQLEKEIQELEQKIEKEKNTKVTVVEYDFDKIKANINAKEKEVQELEVELERQRKLAEQKQKTQNKDMILLQSKINQLKVSTKKQEDQIYKLKTQKEVESKETIEDLKRRLMQEQEKEKRLQEQVKRTKLQAQTSLIQAKSGQTQSTTKDTCCEIM